MSSNALEKWENERQASLDELEAAHRALGGTGPGRRVTTQQINQAYTVLLVSQFQGFCRDLYSNCVKSVVSIVEPATCQGTCEGALMFNLKLNIGNPNSGNLGSDFGRFGIRFWPKIYELDTRNSARKSRLNELCHWRNAIAHQNFDSPLLTGETVRVEQVRNWRSACVQLAPGFDSIMNEHMQIVTGANPW